MQTAKQQWIDASLNAIEGINQAEPTPELWGRIALNIQKKKVSVLSPYQVWIAAASILLLMFINGWVLNSLKGLNTKSKNSAYRIIELYELNPSNVELP